MLCALFRMQMRLVGQVILRPSGIVSIQVGGRTSFCQGVVICVLLVEMFVNRAKMESSDQGSS